MSGVEVTTLAEKESRVREEYFTNPKICENPLCNNSLPFKGRQKRRFCSRSCATKMNVNLSLKRSSRLALKNKCKNCGSRIRNRIHIDLELCRKCKKEEDILTGKITHILLKKWMIDKYGYKCMRCKISSWLGEDLCLDMHHIDGNRNYNIPDNVELLCPNCHSQTDTYKAKNRRKNYDICPVRLV